MKTLIYFRIYSCGERRNRGIIGTIVCGVSLKYGFTACNEYVAM